MTYIISFRRPELRHVLSKMSVPPEADVAVHVRHLQDLGYQIVDVTPPLDDHIDIALPPEGAKAHPRTTELSVVPGATQALRSRRQP